jgi:hypothetical protein
MSDLAPQRRDLLKMMIKAERRDAHLLELGPGQAAYSLNRTGARYN